MLFWHSEFTLLELRRGQYELRVFDQQNPNKVWALEQTTDSKQSATSCIAT